MAMLPYALPAPIELSVDGELDGSSHSPLAGNKHDALVATMKEKIAGCGEGSRNREWDGIEICIQGTAERSSFSWREHRAPRGWLS